MVCALNPPRNVYYIILKRHATQQPKLWADVNWFFSPCKVRKGHSQNFQVPQRTCDNTFKMRFLAKNSRTRFPNPFFIFHHLCLKIYRYTLLDVLDKLAQGIYDFLKKRPKLFFNFLLIFDRKKSFLLSLKLTERVKMNISKIPIASLWGYLSSICMPYFRSLPIRHRPW